MSVLDGFTSAWVRQRPPALRLAAWIVAFLGPALLVLATRLLHWTLVQGGLLDVALVFATLVLVIAIAVAGGIRPALTTVVLYVLARFFLAPPLVYQGVGIGPNSATLACFATAGVAVSLLIAKLADFGAEQAALRRVATLVAHSVPAGQLFAVATEEAGRLVGADYVRMSRYESGELAAVAAWSRTAGQFPASGRWSAVLGFARSFTPARRRVRVADISGTYRPLAEDARAYGIRSAASVPIMATGRTWGVLLTGSTLKRGLPRRTEGRLASFADLLGTAISNAESRASLSRLAEEQMALRRVATLVAGGAPPEAVFTAVTEEAGQLLRVEITSMVRYESDGTSIVVASWGRGAKASVPVGDREPLGGKNLVTIISETSSPARLDHYDGVSGARVERLAQAGFHSAVGAPIMVQGRLWGAVVAASVDQRALSADAEARIRSFTDLVATAVSNAENLAELTASRARVLAAADEARRQIERDLHDGAQQRLVSLTLAVRAAQAAVTPTSGLLGDELASVADGLASVLDDLRELARGIHPSVLSDGGLGPALKTLARRCSVPIKLDVQAIERLPEPVEVAAYYVISEALTNAAKHSNASVVEIGAEIASNHLHLHVLDDGKGGADPALGSGLTGLKDRVEALGGTIAVSSPAGAGTSLDADLPLAA
ncbi:MAG TPA: GAF domain-containing protein [Streptosporangiaceae bacterium]